VPACPSGAWQPLGIGGPTWLSGGRPAEAARAVGEAAQRHVGEGRAAQACSRLGKRPVAANHARGRDRGDQGLEEDDGGPRCNFIEKQGPYFNDLITFKPVLKWRWT
jgi:hypothetical protein